MILIVRLVRRRGGREGAPGLSNSGAGDSAGRQPPPAGSARRERSSARPWALLRPSG